MVIKKILFSCCCIFFWLPVAFAQQDINFTSLTTKEGLSSNSINAILKDRYGLMWFATEDGLNKFDGTNFTVYRHKAGDLKSLQANYILALHEDKDGNLWVGTSGGSLSLYDRKNDAFINFSSNNGTSLIDNSVIRGLCSDSYGRIWIAHFNGVNIFDPQSKKISQVYLTPGKPFTKASICVLQDNQHQMWIGTTEGLYLYSESNPYLKYFSHNSNDLTSISGNTIHAIIEDKKRNLWIGTDSGLSMLQHNSNSFTNYKYDEANPNSLTNNGVNALAVDEENKLWIGTANGLNIFNIGTEKNIQIKFDARKGHGISAKALTSLYIDQEGICWIGTYRAGINKYDKDLNLFNLVKSNPFDQFGLPGSIVSSFAETENGNVYVGTDDGGLCRFDIKTNSFSQVEIRSRLQNSKNRLVVLALATTRNKQLLVGTFSDGLFIMNTTTGKYQQLVKGNGTDDLNSNDIFCIKEDRQGNRWIGTNGDGINVLNKDNKVIVRYTLNPKAPNDVKMPANGYIRDIVEDRHGDFWIATFGGGVIFFEPISGKFTVYTNANSKLPNDKVVSILEDRHGDMWMGTIGEGLGLLNKKTHQFTAISESNGLQNNTVCKILEDQKGIIWISTNKGLSSIDPGTKKINNYSYHNGIQRSNFVSRSGVKTSNGYLFFGGLEGFNYFNPENLKKNNIAPTVLITDLKISNKSVLSSEDGPIKENISIAKRIDLNYKQNFALSFVGLNYTTPDQNNYAYKLEGFDKDWNYVGVSNTAAYTNLDPGEYVFYVKASNSNGVWDTRATSVKIYVHPPFWRTVYAYTLYVLLVIGLLIYIRYKGIQKIKRKYLLEQAKFHAEQERKEAERMHELDQLKLKFLTNLSHEFRTPISLILGPVDNLLLQEKKEPLQVQLNMIKRNGKRLLNLVNQLLDFRKMEEQELKLLTKKGELISFIKDVFDSFLDLSERKKIEFVFTTSIEKFYTDFDHDKIERILFNLLSNAFKFTLEGGIINFDIEKESGSSDSTITWISIRVKDSGIGIPDDKKEAIFERFFQNATAASILNQGSGIGLSITKEFVKMHGGIIDVESEVGNGSTFIVQLPFIALTAADQITALPEVVSTNEVNTEEFPWGAEDIKEEPEIDDRSKKPSILLVEDNDDFRFYLKENLRLHYKVLEATNGIEGWQKALSAHPKLIVSDISMPNMDGIQLCKKIKADKRTNHIPVILLTAFTGENEQIKGLKTGANDYITKPFNFEILNAKIKNLLVLNDTLKSTYTRQVDILTPDVEVESSSDKLLQKIVLHIEENITDTQLSVETLSRHVGMSRSSLYSKLLELTGQTPVEFIRSVKLDKAALLLEKSDMNVAEIAYTVGFSTPNYFAKSFKAKFNILPSEYMTKMRKPGKDNTQGNT